MKHRLIGLALLAACAVPLYSQGGKAWKLITTSDNGTVIYYYNTRQLLWRSRSIREAWIKEEFAKPHKEAGGYGVVLEQFNCTSREVRLLETAHYDPQGNMTKRVDFRETGDARRWQRVIPDTNFEAILDAVCRKRK